MLQVGAVSTINQTHSGPGDNVQHKFEIQIQALAPSNLRNAIALVLASVRTKNVPAAKLQLEMLRATEHGNSEVGDLLDVIELYGGLVEPERTQDAFNAVARVAASTQDDIVKDLCIAALLKFSIKTDYEEAAKAQYQGTPSPGPYSREAFYRFFATREILLEAGRQLVLTEGDLTGIVDGAIRLDAIDIAAPAAARLHDVYPSENSKVLLLITKAFLLNPTVKKRQYWLADPQLKKAVDELAAEVATLIEDCEGNDARLYDMAGPILDYSQVSLPTPLFTVCTKYADQMAASHPEVVARIRSVRGDYSALSEQMRALTDAQNSDEARTAWCQACLASAAVELQDAVFFTRLAKRSELERWLSQEIHVQGANDIECAVVLLFARSQLVALTQGMSERYQLSMRADEFLAEFGARIGDELVVWVVVELAESLFEAALPHKALALTTAMLPEGELWASPFVLLHLKCLLETEQYQSFDALLDRIPEGEQSLSLMHFRSMKEEKLGNPDRAIELSDRMVDAAPDNLHCWLRGCELRELFRDVEEQRRFHDALPDHLLDEYSHEAVVAMRFLTSTGNFKRAETRLVRWFMQDPSGRAVMLVNFHFSHAWRRQAGFEVSSALPGYLEGVEFEQDGQPQVRLIVEEGEATGQYALVRDTQLAQLLVSLEVGQSAELRMVTYTLRGRLPPYVACIRLASQLRHLQNDGSDVFAIIQLPDDPAQFASFLEQKLGADRAQRTAGLEGEIPLYIHMHALQPDNPIKAAMNAWSDSTIAKPQLVDEGIAHPKEIVLDAYSITYLAMTNVVDRLLDEGCVFVLPAETKVLLQRWVADVTHEDFLMMGVSGSGRLVRTTASDVQAREGHTLRGMQRILDEAVVQHPIIHDTSLELYSIKDGIDSTVYLAMQLSSANGLPWFCMDPAFAGLHYSKGHKLANVNSILLRAISTADFDFEERRHGLMLFAFGTLPRTLLEGDLMGLAKEPNPLSGFILYKIFQNHGQKIFADARQRWLLLNVMLTHIISTFYRGDNPSVLAPDYTPWCRYDEHVFNHGLRLFMSNHEGKPAEFWMAVALKVCLQIVKLDRALAQHVDNLFSNYARGHFMDVDAVVKHYRSLP